VIIMALDAAGVRGESARQNADAGLRELIAQAEKHATAADITEAEADTAVEEAMEYVRRRVLDDS
jgi:hypothetical protein